jgi:hypothetical protein
MNSMRYGVIYNYNTKEMSSNFCGNVGFECTDSMFDGICVSVDTAR